MNISVHLIASAILTVALYPLYGINSLLVFIGGFLIDVDHWMWFVQQKKNFSILKAYNYHKNGDCQKAGVKPLNIFHTVEFLVLVFILSLYSTYIFIITLGIYSHMFLDCLHSWRASPTIERYLFLTTYLFRK